jgi:hypothetical protein
MSVMSTRIISHNTGKPGDDGNIENTGNRVFASQRWSSMRNR